MLEKTEGSAFGVVEAPDPDLNEQVALAVAISVFDEDLAPTAPNDSEDVVEVAPSDCEAPANGSACQSSVAIFIWNSGIMRALL